MKKGINRCTAALSVVIGLLLSSQQPAFAADPTEIWKMQMDLQQSKIGRCNLNLQVTHHNLSVNGLGNVVLTVHEGPDIIYELLLDQQLFLKDLRLPARATNRFLVFTAVTSRSLVDAVSAGKTITLVERYPEGDAELRHDFTPNGFRAAHQEFVSCLAKA